jgi:hypothetical protein
VTLNLILYPAKCQDRDEAPNLNRGCDNVLRGEGYRSPQGEVVWTNGGMMVSRGKPKKL